MKIPSLQLLNFKNYDSLHLSLNAQCIAFCGKNGVGKTTILDAIHYVSFTKSFLQNSDKECIKHNEAFFHIQAAVNDEYDDLPHLISIYVDREKGKKIKVNDKIIERLSEHIGFVPIILIAPSDMSIVSESAEHRRKYFDAFISQLDKNYLELLIQHQKLLMQRNALLKQSHSPHFLQQLAFFDERLITVSIDIFKIRKNFINHLNTILPFFHHKIVDNNSSISIEYFSQLLNEDYELILKNNLKRDIELGFTEKGIHRDEFLFLSDGHNMRKFGSQGQQKSFLLALKVSQYQITYQHLSKKPIILIDDIFDKLDESRAERLLITISQLETDQIFITDTHFTRLKSIIPSFFTSSSIHLIHSPTHITLI
ncbi:MAG: DNA replication and repair protein RecF [Bacteroidales bacterium]|nr:DNA replication and repair protein RecF [Bacteroidales bacterium]